MTKIAKSAGFSHIQNWLSNFFKRVFSFFNPSKLLTQFNAFMMLENLDSHIGFFIPS